MFLVLFVLQEDNQIERETEHDVADVAVEVVEVEEGRRVQERILTPGIEVADVVVSSLVLGLLGIERCLEDGDCIEDADYEQAAHVQLVLLVSRL